MIRYSIILVLLNFAFTINSIKSQNTSFSSLIPYSSKGSSEYHQANLLPPDFPEIIINVSDDPEPGYVFINPCGIWGFFPDAASYLAILDNYGTPIFYRKMPIPTFDLKIQGNGTLTFHDMNIHKHIIMDSSYNITGQADVGQGYGTDFHEFLILENNHMLLLGTDHRLVDMDTVVPGGHPGVTVVGTYIEERDENGLKVFQWSSFDHYQITDGMEYIVDFTDPNEVDYVHANALEQDTETTLLISARNMEEITKINKLTGEIIWRLGGKNNEFQFINDSLKFNMQHDIRRLPNGNYMLFDNGPRHSPQRSSAVEYQLDEVNKTTTLVKRYSSVPEDIFGSIMGSSQRLPGGNTFVGWGSGNPNVTEFKPDGTKALEFEYESISYRARKYPWKTTAIIPDPGTLNFGQVQYLDSTSRLINIKNNTIDFMPVTGMVSNTGKYQLITLLPVNIPPGVNAWFEIMFKPGSIGNYSDVLTICSDIENATITQRIACQVFVKGIGAEEAGLAEQFINNIQVFPNPTKGLLDIELPHFTKPLKIEIINTAGNVVYSGGLFDSSTRVNIKQLSKGIYLLKITDPGSGMAYMHKIVKY